MVRDLTYIRVVAVGNYIYVLIDLFNHEIISYSAVRNKDAKLVSHAFASVKNNLSKINIFHTNRGNEFKNKIIDETLKTFVINRSLSMKGCPYDNTVVEVSFKIIKTEFVRQYSFENFDELNYELSDFAYCFNNQRICSSLDYLETNHIKRVIMKKQAYIVHHLIRKRVNTVLSANSVVLSYKRNHHL